MKGNVGARIEPSEVKLKGGETAEAVATIKNLGQTVDQFTLTVDGIDPSWYTLPVSSVALFPNDEDMLRIVLHPPETVGGHPARYALRIVVTSRDSPGEMATADLAIVIGSAPKLELELDISPKEAMGREATYQVQLRNPRNTEVVAQLDATDETRRLRLRLAATSLTVSGNGRAETTLDIRPNWLGFFGGESPFTFKVGAAIREGNGGFAPAFCVYCGHELQPRYRGIPLLGPWYARKLQKRVGGPPVFCACCSRVVAAGARTAEAQFVRTSWTRSLRSLRRIRFLRPLFGWCERQPVIDTFRVTTQDQRDFTISWSVMRARQVKLDDQEVEPKGDIVVRPTGVTTYKLTAVNRRKISSETVEVRPLPAPVEKTSARIGAALSQPKVKAQAGAVPGLATLEVQNLGEIVDKFTIGLEGIDESWCDRSAASVALMPQGKGQVQLSFHPPKREGVRAGEYDYAISVRSQADPNEATVVVGRLEILPYPECKLDVRPTRVSCRRKGTFRVGIINTGSADLKCSLAAHDLDEGLRFLFKRKKPEVASRAWSSTEVPMIARPKRGAFIGEDKRYDIVVSLAAPGIVSQQANCQLHHRPFMQSSKTVVRVVKALIALVLLVVIVYLLITWGGGWSQLIHSPGDWAHQLITTIKGWFS